VELGHVYTVFGEYNEAMTQGFNEAEYIIEHSLDSCSHSLLKSYILSGQGEILLRKGKLDTAESKLTEAIFMRCKLVGESCALKSKTLRAEARIRIGRLAEAYEDCTSILKIEQKEKNNYFNLLCLTCFYHAAIIKYKQGDLEKSLEHFIDFFKGMKSFCQGFLDEKEYKELEEKGVFVESIYDKDRIKDHVTQCLHHSTFIFAAIHGPTHPFVRDYVIKNYE
jgi:tetratricopeptide (TPR) repeat protein